MANIDVGPLVLDEDPVQKMNETLAMMEKQPEVCAAHLIFHSRTARKMTIENSWDAEPCLHLLRIDILADFPRSVT